MRQMVPVVEMFIGPGRLRHSTAGRGGGTQFEEYSSGNIPASERRIVFVVLQAAITYVIDHW